MAKTRSKGPISPGTPLSDKMKKIKTKSSVEASPSLRKVKEGKIDKKVKKSPKKIHPVEEETIEESGELVSNKVAQGALKELKKYVETQEKPNKSELFDDEDDKNVYLQITTKKYFSDKPNFKPKVIKLSHSIISKSSDSEDFKTCLILRDQLITENSQLEKIEGENISTLSKILTLKDIKTEYKPFEKKRQLYNDYDLFLVDDALLNSMPSLLGKVFYNKGNSKVPLPIKVVSSSNPKQFSVQTFKNQLEKCLSSTFFLPPMGVNILIKFGIINKNLDNELVENLQDILKTFNKDSLRSVMLKTSTSPALPLFYNDKIYDDSDILKAKSKKEKSNELSAFEKGLLEIGDVDEVTKIVGSKLSRKLKNQS
ncbi:proteasome-interacting protein Cic1p [[Candida] jaroonii]|uniref:Proteasome-interacting protein Cic1p n=1 Tax=[Candida] jaroonii TaxID=467808 RepID=A0ACA9YAF8_9ASCO|nr:proteasome-interacting protein Cic1p [[Candida] jaroonii]